MSADAGPTKASGGKLKAPEIPLTDDIIQDVAKSTKYESEITSAVNGPLDCPHGLSDPGDDSEKIRQNALTVTYLRQSINAGNNQILQQAAQLRKYNNKGYLLWATIQKMVARSPADAPVDDTFTTTLNWLKRPAWSDTVTGGKLTAWQVKIEVAQDVLHQEAGDDEEKNKLAATITDESILQSLIKWGRGAKPPLPPYVLDKSSLADCRQSTTLDELFEKLAKYGSLDQDLNPDGGSVAAFSSSGGDKAPDSPCHLHPNAKKPHTNRQCSQQKGVHGKDKSDKKKSKKKKEKGAKNVCFQWQKEQKCSRGDKCRFEHPDSKAIVRYDAQAALGDPNPIDSATGEPRKCADCGSQFHEAGSTRCKEQGQTVAAFTSKLSKIEHTQQQTADVLLRLSENMGRLHTAITQQQPLPAASTQIVQHQRERAPPPVQAVTDRGIDGVLARALAAQVVFDSNSGITTTDSDDAILELAHTRDALAMIHSRPTESGPIPKVAEVTTHRPNEAETSEVQSQLFDSGAGISVTSALHTCSKITWYAEARHYVLGDGKTHCRQFGVGIRPELIKHQGAWVRRDVEVRIGDTQSDSITSLERFRKAHGYKFIHETDKGDVLMRAPDGHILQVHIEHNQWKIWTKSYSFFPKVPQRYRQYFPQYHTVGPAQASVSAVKQPAPSQPSKPAGPPEDATQFDLNLEFAVSKLHEGSIEEHATAIKVACKGQSLSTCGDCTSEHVELAAIGRKSFAKGDHVDVQYPERVQPYHAIVTKASNKSIRVDFTDGSYALIRAPFKAVTKVDCNCDAFDASSQQKSGDSNPTPIQPGPPPKSPPSGSIKPEPPPQPGAATAKLKAQPGTLPPPPPLPATGYRVSAKSRMAIDVLDSDQLIKVAKSTEYANLNRNERQYIRLKLAKTGCYTYDSGQDTLLKIHCLLAHRSWKVTASVAAKMGYKLDGVQKAFCAHCAEMNLSRRPVKKDPAPVSEKAEVDRLTRFRTDVFGPFPASRFGSYKYVTVFVDDGGTVYSYFSPDMKTMPEIQEQFIADVRRDLPAELSKAEINVHMHNLKVGSDGAKYFLSKAAEAVWKQHGATHHRSPPGKPQFNGRAERIGQTLYASAAACMRARGADKNLWPEAWRHAAEVHDLLPSRALPGNISPREFRTGKPASFNHLKPIFAPCFVRVLGATGKWEGKARKGIVLGYNRQADCTNVLTSASRKSVRVASEDIIVDDTVPRVVAEQRLNSVPDLWVDADDVSITNQHQQSANNFVASVSPISEDGSNILELIANGAVNFVGLDEPTPSLHGSPPSAEICSITDVDAWAELCNTHDRVAAQRSSSQLHYHLKGALNDPVHGQLIQPGRVYNGVNKEINGLCARIDPATGVPEGGKPLFPLSKDDLQPGERIHRALALYYPVFNADGGFKKYKLRICFNGAASIKGVDYDQTATHQPRKETVRLHFALTPKVPGDDATATGDIGQAYVKAENVTPTGKRELIALPVDLSRYAGLLDRNGNPFIWRVDRALYGKKNGGYLWERKLDEWMQAKGWQPSDYEPQMYYRHNSRVIVHTDDFCIRGPITEVKRFELEMTERWGDCGFSYTPEQYLGYQLSQDKDGMFGLSMAGCIKAELERRGLRNTQTRRTPLPSDVSLTKYDRATGHQGVTNLIQSANGFFQYIVQSSRPDLAKTASMYSQVQSCPKRNVLEYTHHTWQYLNHTADWMIQYKKLNPQLRDVLEVFVDASHNDDADGKSTAGWLIYINGAPVDWSCELEPIATNSSAESELVAAQMAIQSLLFLRHITDEMGYGQPRATTVWEDNSCTHGWVTEYKLTKKNKHIHKKYWLARQTQLSGETTMLKIDTKLQRADLLTKNCTFDTHDRLMRMMLTAPPGWPARREQPPTT